MVAVDAIHFILVRAESSIRVLRRSESLLIRYRTSASSKDDAQNREVRVGTLMDFETDKRQGNEFVVAFKEFIVRMVW
jgi:hypothetical protein